VCAARVMMGRMTDYEIPRPTTGDVVDLIVADHRLLEDLLRDLRDATADREAARTALAELLIAHGESEEEHVYPTLKRKRAITEHEKEHGEEEHAEGNEALLALLECKGTDTQKFDDAVEELATALNHHIGEEEQTILNPARTEVSQDVRQDLGRTWVRARNGMLDEGCASVDQVRTIVERAVAEGTLAPQEAREKADAVKEEAKARAEEIEEAAKKG
jgi:hemerythrin-like domain-containing protein